MPTFSSAAALKAYILRRSVTAVNEATNAARDTLDDCVDKFYSQEPEYYLRTDRLRSSLTAPAVTGNSNEVTGEVHFDEGMLDYPVGPISIKQPLPNGDTMGYSNYVNHGGSTAVLNAAMTGNAGTLNWTNNTAIWNESIPVLRGKMYKELKDDLRKAGVPVE